MNIIQKIEQIKSIIDDIETEEPMIASVLREAFQLGAIVAKEAVERNGREGPIDISHHIEFINRALGYDLEEAVKAIMQGSDQPQKTADEATLNFITSDLDDYEKFLAANAAKKDIDFLSKEI